MSQEDVDNGGEWTPFRPAHMEQPVHERSTRLQARNMSRHGHRSSPVRNLSTPLALRDMFRMNSGRGIVQAASSVGVTSTASIGAPAALEDEDIKAIRLFQKTVESKVHTFLEVIERRRNSMLQAIEQDRARLKNAAGHYSPDTTEFVERLQKNRRKAIETEAAELQKLRMKFLTVIEEYKRALSEYYNYKQQGKKIPNPTGQFQDWVDSLDPYKNSGLGEEFHELSSFSKQFVQSLISITQKPVNFQTRYNSFPLQKLPSEVLHLVLEKLSHKSDIVLLLTVCKLWAQIIVKILYYRPHISKKTQLDLFMRTMKTLPTETIFDYRSMIKRLNFSFVGDYMHDEELNYFVGCYNLERLTLVFCKHITSSSISSVLKGCRFLQSVDITGIRDVSDDVFNTLAECCPRVQGFYVPQATHVSWYSLNNFITHSPILKRVKITANDNVNDELVEILANKCPLLVEVDITLSPNVHDHSLLNLFTKLSQLREFRITHNTNVSDKLFLELSKKVVQLPALRLLDLSGCENITDKTIERIVLLAPKLRNVFLGKCSRITDDSLYHLSKLGKNLQTVHFGHCFNITDQGVRILVQSCPRIQYVDFACCTNLTNRTLYELSDLTKLKRIGLVKCSQMTDEGLLNMISLRGRNDSLERVHLSYCSNLTIYPIYELLMACPRLSHLSLTAVPSFLRPDITSFCRPAPPDFSENQKQIFCVFSGKGVQKLRHYLMSLTTPTNGPQTDIRDVLTKYVLSKNMLLQDESLEDAISRITRELNQDSAAVLAAAGLTQVAGPDNEIIFQSIDFEKLDNIFTWISDERLQNISLSKEEENRLLDMVDSNFCADPFSEEYDESEGIVAPTASNDVNLELCHVVRKFHELDDRTDDFEVNVSSLARVQFQFTGFLLHEMVQIHFKILDLNRQLCDIQSSVIASGIENNIKGLHIWRYIFAEKFSELVRKYKLSTVVLRLYLKDSIGLLTRQRELMLAEQRNTLHSPGTQGDLADQANALEQVRNRIQATPEEMRVLQFGLRTRTIVGNPGVRMPLDLINGTTNDDHSETPEDDAALEDI